MGGTPWRVNKENVFSVLDWIDNRLLPVEKYMLFKKTKEGYELSALGLELQKYLKNDTPHSFAEHLAYRYFCLNRSNAISYSDFLISDRYSKKLTSYYSTSMSDDEIGRVLELTNDLMKNIPKARLKVMNYLRVKNLRASKGFTNVTLSHDTYNRLSDLAKKQGLPISQVITDLLPPK